MAVLSDTDAIMLACSPNVAGLKPERPKSDRPDIKLDQCNKMNPLEFQLKKNWYFQNIIRNPLRRNFTSSDFVSPF